MFYKLFIRSVFRLFFYVSFSLNGSDFDAWVQRWTINNIKVSKFFYSKQTRSLNFSNISNLNLFLACNKSILNVRLHKKFWFAVFDLIDNELI